MPLDKIAGSILQVSVEAYVKDVTKPDQPYNGVKVMLHVTSTNRSDSWDQADANGNTFPVTYDWKKLSFRTPIPRTVTHATLVLGLQGLRNCRFPQCLDQDRSESANSAYRRRQRSGLHRTFPGRSSRRNDQSRHNSRGRHIDTLKQWNVNLIRWQLTWGGFPQSKADTADQAAYDVWLNGSLQHLDGMLPYFKKAHILVVLDLHTPPEAATLDVDRVFTDASWQKHFIDCWRKMATRYRGEKANLGLRSI